MSQGTCITRRNSLNSTIKDFSQPLRIVLPFVACRVLPERKQHKSPSSDYHTPSKSKPVHVRTPAQVSIVRGQGFKLLKSLRSRSNCRSTSEATDPPRLLSNRNREEMEVPKTSPKETAGENQSSASLAYAYTTPPDKCKPKRLRSEHRLEKPESGYELMRFLSESRKKESIDAHFSDSFEPEPTTKKVSISIPLPYMERSHSVMCEAVGTKSEGKREGKSEGKNEVRERRRHRPKVWSVRECIRRQIDWVERCQKGAKGGPYVRGERGAVDSVMDVHDSVYCPRSVRKPIRLL